MRFTFSICVFSLAFLYYQFSSTVEAVFCGGISDLACFGSENGDLCGSGICRCIGAPIGDVCDCACETGNIMCVPNAPLTLPTMNGDRAITLNNIIIDVDDDLVVIKACGDDDKWFAMGFGALVMAGTYDLIFYSQNETSLELLPPHERHAPGNFRPIYNTVQRLTTVNCTTSGGTTCCRVSRPISGQGDPENYDFPTSPADIPTIMSVGPSLPFNFHGVGDCNSQTIPLRTLNTNTGGHGDPHYTTLNQISFKYDGPCSYILLTNRNCPIISNNSNNNNNNGDDLFSLVVHHGRCRTRTKNIVCIKGFTISLNDRTLEMSSDNKLFVDGKEYIARFEDDLWSISSVHYEIDYQGEYTSWHVRTKTANKWAFQMSNEGVGKIMIEQVPSYFKMKACGLLASTGYNNNMFISSNGELLSSDKINQFGDSWMISSKETQPLVCDMYPTQSYEMFSSCKYHPRSNVSSICDTLIQKYSKILRGKKVDQCFKEKEEEKNKIRFRKIDPTRIYDDCITEICNCDRSSVTECEPVISLALFKRSCLSNNVLSFPQINFADIVRAA